jgi:isopentenyl-diphosphate delta-isomerase
MSSERKKDHIELAFKSQIYSTQADDRFYFEPMLSGHPDQMDLSSQFLKSDLKHPVWISSMTGGTEKAYMINRNLAKLCKEFGLGMGLGSCRPLLDSMERFDDFNLRPIIGDQPLFANLGIAQIEQLLRAKRQDKIEELVKVLNADGLIIHINPLQEWAQEEGDRFTSTPLEIINECLQLFDFSIIVKEVGQGIGPKSLKELMKLPLAAIEFGALGGTNFTALELSRAEEGKASSKAPFSLVGHSAEEMCAFCNEIKIELQDQIKVQHLIISGGVKDYLHGYYLMKKLNFPSIYGHASAFLQPALESYEALRKFFIDQMYGLKMAHAYLTVK